MLGVLTDPAAVGVYAVAARIADLVAFALTAINTMFTPQIAALHASGDRRGLQAMVTTTSWWAMMSALAIALPLFVLAGFILSFFGAAFTSGSLALRILLLGQLVNAASRIGRRDADHDRARAPGGGRDGGAPRSPRSV